MSSLRADRLTRSVDPANEDQVEGRDRNDLAFAIGVFLVNAVICIEFFGPQRQGYGDVVRGWHQFNSLLQLSESGWGPWNDLELRVLMVAISLAELSLLCYLKLVERTTAVAFLALPAAAYLATKIKVEFLFFPLALISTRLPWYKEVLVLGGVLGASVLLNEQNGYVIAAYRLSVLGLRKFRIRSGLFALAVLAAVVLGEQFDLLASRFSSLAAYGYTRDIANPDYSILETAIVFLSSTVFSVNPFVDYRFAIPSTLLVLTLAFGRRLWSPSAWRSAASRPEFRALVLTVVLFTSITHAFQNARYYFFYVPLLGAALGPVGRRRLMLMSIPVTVLMAFFYSALGWSGQAILEDNMQLWQGRI